MAPTFTMMGVGGESVPAAVVSGYTGPGDVIPGATAFYGLRAYTGASIGSNVVDILRSSDSTTKTFVSIAGGGINTSDAFFNGSTYTITTLYDQTGTGNDLSAHNLAAFPSFVLSAQGVLPTIRGSGTQSIDKTSGATTVNQPYSMVFVAKRTGKFGSPTVVFGCQGSGNVQFGLGDGATNNVALLYTGGAAALDATAADSTYHAVAGFGNGASSALYVEGSNTGTGGPNSTDVVTISYNLFNTAGVNSFVGDIMEFGLWSGDKSASFAALYSNQRAYYSTTWNPSDKGASITLSNNNLTITGAVTGTYENIRSTGSASAGKVYWELHCDLLNANPGTIAEGVGNASATLSGALTFAGFDNNSIGWVANGAVLLNGGSVGTVAAWTTGDTLGFALDIGNAKIWFRTNGGGWNNDIITNQNPANNTGGISIAAITGALFAFGESITVGDAFTANFGGSAFAQTPPAGFVDLFG